MASAATALLQQAPIAALRLDAGGRVVDWNDAAGRLLGLTREHAVDRPIAELVPIPDGELGWRELLAGPHGATRTWPTRRPDGGALVVEWVVQPLRDVPGEPGGLMCYGHDITVEAEARRKVKVERIALRAILDNISVFVWMTDARGVYTFLDGMGLERFGPSPGVALGRNLLDVFADNPAIDLLRRGLAGHYAHFSASFAGAEWENWQIPSRDGDGRVTGLVGVSLDVTDLRRNERVIAGQLALIERQQREMRELSTPIIEIWDQVLTLPIVGLVDRVRTDDIMDGLLQAVTRARAKFAILDMTGVNAIDVETARNLIELVRAIALLGAQGILAGIHPNIARTVVDLDIDLAGLAVWSSLREALRHCIARVQAGR